MDLSTMDGLYQLGNSLSYHDISLTYGFINQQLG